MSLVQQARYERLIVAAVARGCPAGYFERHHILPRSEGGTDVAGNLVCLTAREHFLAHWLLYRIHRTPASARSFKLMVHGQRRRRGRDYAAARAQMSMDMRGDKNVSRRPEVRVLLKQNCYSSFAGKKRPEHSALMSERGVFCGTQNPFFGKGAQQAGALNHMARKVNGLHIYAGVAQWNTATEAAKCLGVSLQAVAQAVRKKARSKGWRLEYTE